MEHGAEVKGEECVEPDMLQVKRWYEPHGLTGEPDDFKLI